MAETLISLDEASKQLKLSKEQIIEMVKKGALRGFLDQKTYKFRPTDIEAYKKRSANNAASPSQPPAIGKRKDETTKIDLTEIPGEPEGEDKDQTSVLAPVDEGAPKEKADELPSFEFSEQDIGLQKEEPPALEEGDQTSLLMPAEPKPGEDKKESKPALDFAEKNVKLPLDEDTGDSVLVADESESSVDILEVTEESSSESASSASGMQISEEPSSGEGVKAPIVDESSTSAVHPPAGTTDSTVTDILGLPAEDSSDEAMETLEVDEVVETHEAVSEEAVKPEEPSSPETVPVAEGAETAGLPPPEETKAAVDTSETAAVSGAVAEAIAAAGEKEEEISEPEPAVAPGAWETVTPSAMGNGFLIAAAVMLVLGGAMLFCEMCGIHNGLTAKLVGIFGSRPH